MLNDGARKNKSKWLLLYYGFKLPNKNMLKNNLEYYDYCDTL